MIELKTQKISEFKILLESIKELTIECNINFTDIGLEIGCMDGSHVSYLCLFISSEWFDNYKCKKNITIGININNILKCLNFIKKDETLMLSTSDDMDSLKINFKDYNNILNKSYNIKKIEIDMEKIEIPDIEYNNIISINSLFFQKLIKELSQLGETISIDLSNEKLSFNIINTTDIDAIFDLNFDDEEKIKIIKHEQDLNLQYSSKYLNCFFKPYSLFEDIEINLSYESPLLMKYNIDNMCYLKYYLAPKIDE
jgi:proliferating cell nuclear antigen